MGRYVTGLLVVMCLAAPACQASVSSAGDTDEYLAMWDENWGVVATDLEPLAPTASSPGVCNAGGDTQGCHDASKRLLADFIAFQDVLVTFDVPEGVEEAHDSLGQALAKAIEGTQLRVKAIEKQDDAAWDAANEALKEASALSQQAYQQFPDFARPSVVPSI
jgi:hypothetical protein